jgi:hypothetical protein
MRPAALRDQPVRVPEVDSGPEFPELLGYLWRWFQEISWGLAPNGFAPPMITWETLRAWQAIGQIELDPWEARALVQLGMLRASIQAEKTGAANREHKPPSIGSSSAPRPAVSMPRR